MSRSRGGWLPSPVTGVLVAAAAGLAGNLATNTVDVPWRWWPAAAWTATGLLLATSAVFEWVRHRSGADPVGTGAAGSDLGCSVRSRSRRSIGRSGRTRRMRCMKRWAARAGRHWWRYLVNGAPGSHSWRPRTHAGAWLMATTSWRGSTPSRGRSPDWRCWLSSWVSARPSRHPRLRPPRCDDGWNTTTGLGAWWCSTMWTTRTGWPSSCRRPAAQR